MTLKDAMIKYKSNILVCTVERGEEAYIPKGDLTFAGRDVVSIIASSRSITEFLGKINYKTRTVKDATLIGGGDITHYLCEMLTNSGISVKVIEKSTAVCDELASQFPSITVINGDPADEDILREERVAESDAFIALTSLDEENILLSLFAKNAGSKKVMTRINRIEYDSVIAKLDLDSIIYPKNLTADTIVRYVRARQNTLGSSMESLYNLIKGEVEVAEFIVGENSPIVGKPLHTLTFKDNALVAAILRGRQLIIPRGAAVIESGDSVVTVTKELFMRDISDLLRQ